MFCLLSLGACLVVMPHEERSFVSWMRAHNTIYTGSEYSFRLGIFLTNKRFVESFRGSCQLGLNKFSCMTQTEYRALLGMRPYLAPETAPRRARNGALPESVDWREKGAVTPVQDQGVCGSCWAFAAIATQEGVWAAAGNELLKLSEQNIVDCTKAALGCHGGLPELGLQSVIDTQGGKFMLLSDYPYVAWQNSCVFDAAKGVSHVSKITVYRTEDDLLTCVGELGPTAIGFDASTNMFRQYTSGIFNCDYCTDEQNHAMTVVGYGVEDGTKYWIVKNSWGPTWGEKGYIKVIRGVNMCGIQRTVTAVVEL